METTAACPAFAYAAQETAAVVKRLEDAGAILVGKTNMDQFATGLVGVRSPYGACSSVFNEDYISGGSSSGSAVAVANGLVSFSLGTDTAGSGRVPAAFNNLIGLKPTRGVLSTRGIVPACRSLDCVSIFALTAADARQVFRPPADLILPTRIPALRPSKMALRPGSAARFGSACRSLTSGSSSATMTQNACTKTSIHALESLGGIAVPFDFRPVSGSRRPALFRPLGRGAPCGPARLFQLHAEEMQPIVRGIITGGAKFSAVDGFLAQYRLEAIAAADQTKSGKPLICCCCRRPGRHIPSQKSKPIPCGSIPTSAITPISSICWTWPPSPCLQGFDRMACRSASH